eukprot:TRINITY_DN10861_c0_g1_i2.p1 TRINITY_DN10861_c0_g1~~TRINITY_DN10861_c0_g1_i2.p1  ORF type:complete len:1514 (-),score=230.96 TRINITY_DN10861_c0_g1_i2:308-4246(-)
MALPKGMTKRLDILLENHGAVKEGDAENLEKKDEEIVGEKGVEKVEENNEESGIEKEKGKEVKLVPTTPSKKERKRDSKASRQRKREALLKADFIDEASVVDDIVDEDGGGHIFPDFLQPLETNPIPIESVTLGAMQQSQAVDRLLRDILSAESEAGPRNAARKMAGDQSDNLAWAFLDTQMRSQKMMDNFTVFTGDTMSDKEVRVDDAASMDKNRSEYTDNGVMHMEKAEHEEGDDGKGNADGRIQVAVRIGRPACPKGKHLPRADPFGDEACCTHCGIGLGFTFRAPVRARGKGPDDGLTRTAFLDGEWAQADETSGHFGSSLWGHSIASHRNECNFAKMEGDEELRLTDGDVPMEEVVAEGDACLSTEIQAAAGEEAIEEQREGNGAKSEESLCEVGRNALELQERVEIRLRPDQEDALAFIKSHLLNPDHQPNATKDLDSNPNCNPDPNPNPKHNLISEANPNINPDPAPNRELVAHDDKMRTNKKQQKQGGGCVFAGEPGMGKTAVTVVFLSAFFAKYPKGQCLLVLKKGLLENWQGEFEKWRRVAPNNDPCRMWYLAANCSKIDSAVSHLKEKASLSASHVHNEVKGGKGGAKQARWNESDEDRDEESDDEVRRPKGAVGRKTVKSKEQHTSRSDIADNDEDVKDDDDDVGKGGEGKEDEEGKEGKRPRRKVAVKGGKGLFGKLSRVDDEERVGKEVKARRKASKKSGKYLSGKLSKVTLHGAKVAKRGPRADPGVMKWATQGGILVTTYGRLGKILGDKEATMCGPTGAIIRDKARVVVCDEAHQGKTFAKRVNLAISRMKTPFRLLITGTPLQNKHEELYNILSLAQPHNMAKSFLNLLAPKPKAQPASKANHVHSTPNSKDEAPFARRSVRARFESKSHPAYMDPPSDNDEFEPSKKRKRGSSLKEKRNQNSRAAFLHAITGKDSELRKVALTWLQEQVQKYLWKQEGIRSSTLPELNEFVLMLRPPPDQRHAIGRFQVLLGKSGRIDLFHHIRGLCAHPCLLATALLSEDTDKNLTPLRDILLRKQEDWSTWRAWREKREPMYSAKTHAVMELAALCDERKEKAIVFCKVLAHMDLLTELLGKIPRLWRVGHQIFRLSGALSAEARTVQIREFNERPESRLLLATLGLGEGLNIQSATRVVMFDVDWNPTVMEQALARAWRTGQTRPVHVYILITKDTLEENVLDTTIRKETLGGEIFGPSFTERPWQTVASGPTIGRGGGVLVDDILVNRLATSPMHNSSNHDSTLLSSVLRRVCGGKHTKEATSGAALDCKHPQASSTIGGSSGHLLVPFSTPLNPHHRH